MDFIIDTNVLAERVKEAPDPGVIEWLNAQEELVVSTATIYEIEFGIKELERQRGKKAKSVCLLVEWFGTLLPYLIDMPVTRSIALKAASYSSQKKKKGLSVDMIDMVIAATAQETQRTLVTRNIRDFGDIPGITLLNPFH